MTSAHDPSQAARIFTPVAGTFSRGLPQPPAKVFDAERDQALSPKAPTSFIPLDIAELLELPYPATTPIMLARYLVVAAGDTFSHRLRASGEIYYAISGSGVSDSGGQEIAWSAGDVFTFPGGEETRHTAKDGSVLFLVTNEPELAFGGFDPPRPEHRRTTPALYTADAIEVGLQGVTRGSAAPVTAEYVNLTNEAMWSMRTMLPSLVVGINTLEAGRSQRPHRHNAAAITLSIQGEGVYSTIAGERFDWSPHAVMLTPPNQPHAHFNEGDAMMKSLVIQDGGLYHYCRATGFTYADEQ